MAVTLAELPYFKALASRKGYRGRLMTFGRTTVEGEDASASTSEAIYRALGFEDVASLDLSTYQGATHVHDLNDPDTPEALRGQFDFVIVSGTLEHVFHWQNALKVAFDLLKVGGTLVFGSPANNWADHGFYQFSPTLKFDFFAENDWTFGESIAELQWPGSGIQRSVPLYPKETRFLNAVRARGAHTLDIIKGPGTVCDRAPVQSLYAERFGQPQRRFRFAAREPLEFSEGCVTLPEMTQFDLAAKDFQADGRGYKIRFRADGQIPSAPKRPFRSRALVYEDGVLLPWIVSDPAMVAERAGSFAHHGGFIHLTPTDGGDPRDRARNYSVAFPSYPWMLAWG